MNKREKSTIIDIYRGILVDTYLIGLDKEDSRREFTRLLDLLGLKEERYRVENKILAKKMELTEVQEEAYEMMFNDCIKYGVYAKYGDELLGVSLPDQVVCKVKEAEDAVQGNSVTNAMKKAWLESGF